MSVRHSFPKSKIKVLLLEGIHQSAVDEFRKQGYSQVELLPHGLPERELIAKVKNVHILGIRSATQVTAKVINQAPKLMVIGCFSVGTNQVDLSAANAAGIPVFNAPFSNTRSVAELVTGHIFSLLRGINEKSAAAHRGQWLKTAKDSYEVRGKTLGLIGYGRIGSQVSVLAEAIGMNVIYYDPIRQLPLGNAQAVKNMKAVLSQADVISLHVPGLPATKGMIGEREIKQMKPGARLINASRGNVVDIPAVVAALKSKQLAGAAFDVFPAEPKSNKEEFKSPLRKFDNVILTPHIGAATSEAQKNIGTEVADKLITYSDNGSTGMAVNFPNVELPSHKDRHRILHIHDNQPGVLSAINEVFARNPKTNITGQYLQTDRHIGYVVVDIDAKKAGYPDMEALGNITGTIRTRILY